MPRPKTPKEVKHSLGLIGYYRKFIPKFSDLARSLRNLTRHDTEFIWTEKCDNAFKHLKELLMQHPILRYPDPSRGYTLFTDASGIGWAGVLTQEFEDDKGKKKHHPICYVSGQFRGSQQNWAALTKEAYVIYMAVRKLSFYITDAEVTIKCDHLPLKKFLQKQTLNAKINNWAALGATQHGAEERLEVLKDQKCKLESGYQTEMKPMLGHLELVSESDPKETKTEEPESGGGDEPPRHRVTQSINKLRESKQKENISKQEQRWIELTQEWQRLTAGASASEGVPSVVTGSSTVTSTTSTVTSTTSSTVEVEQEVDLEEAMHSQGDEDDDGYGSTRLLPRTELTGELHMPNKRRSVNEKRKNEKPWSMLNNNSRNR